MWNTLNSIKRGIWFLLKVCFFDSILGCADLYRFVVNTHIDTEIQDLIDYYKLKYLTEGWNVLASIIKIGCALTIIIAHLVLDSDHPYLFRVRRVPSSMMVLIAILNATFQKFKFVREN